MTEFERFKKLRLIKKFLVDYLIDKDSALGLITIQQEIEKEVKTLLREVIKNDNQLNRLYRSAIRHLSEKQYNQLMA